jgi:hypothetical protein
MNSDVLEGNDLDAVSLLEAKYCIPLLWLALFRPNDVRLHHNAPVLLASKEEAISTWATRKEGICRFLGAPSQEIVAGWEEFIHFQSASIFLLDTRELWLMEDEEGQFTIELGAYFSDFDKICSSERVARDLAVVVQASRNLCSFPYVGTSLHLCGFSIGSTVPWPLETGKAAAFLLDSSGFLVEELLPDGRPLNAEVKKSLLRAHDRKLKPFACISANWCTPCLEMFEVFFDPRLADTLNGIHLIKLDLEQWNSEFESIGVEGLESVPLLMQLNEEGMVTGRTIDGNAWDESTPDQLSQALGPFFHEE